MSSITKKNTMKKEMSSDKDNRNEAGPLGPAFCEK